MHYPLEMHMVHKLFRTNTSNATNPVYTPSSTPGATLQRAAVIGIMFAYECVLVLRHCALHLTDCP